MIECRGLTAVVPSVLLPLYSIIGTFALKGVSRENGCWPRAPVPLLMLEEAHQGKNFQYLSSTCLVYSFGENNWEKGQKMVRKSLLCIVCMVWRFSRVCRSKKKKNTTSLKAFLWLRINLVVHHSSSQAFIKVWVFLMSCKLEIIQCWSINMDCQFVMACHSVQTDKLLCCRSGYQIKQIERVINCKRWKKKSITVVWKHQMIHAFLFTQLLYSFLHLHALLSNHPN